MSPDAGRFEAFPAPRAERRSGADRRRLQLVDLALERQPSRAAAPVGSSGSGLRFDEADLARACAAVERRVAADADRQAASATAEAEMELQRALGSALEALVGERAERLALVDRTARSLALAVVRRCLGQPRPELDLEIEALVRSALGRIEGHGRLEVFLAPADTGRMAARLPALAAAAGFEGELVCRADPGLAGGSVRVLWGEAWAERDIGGWLERLAETMGLGGEAPGTERDGPMAGEIEG